MNRRFRKDEPCPCDSGKVIRDCCLRADGRLLPLICKTVVPAVGEFQHPKCYASELRNCSQTITAEHFVSEGVLNDLQEGGRLMVTGFPWQPDPKTPISVAPAALTAKVLCEHHNWALSPLDAIGIRFMKCIKLALNPERPALVPERREWWLFNGHDIERWLLKVLCGTASAGNLRFQGQRLSKTKPPSEILDLLYGKTWFSGGTGLYLANGLNDEIRDQNNFSFAPWMDETGQIIRGCIFMARGFGLLLALMPPDRTQNPPIDRSRATHRPEGIVFRCSDPPREAAIVIGWLGMKRNKVIEMEVQRAASAPPENASSSQ